MKKLYLVALVVFTSIVDLHAQQDPHYTQYMYNMSVMNPAYAEVRIIYLWDYYTESNGLR